MNKIVSIVIPCYNEEKYIKLCLDSILLNGVSVEAFEIIIVDGESEDATLDIVETYRRNYDNIFLFSNTKRITPTSLNIGISNAKGKYILIASAHAAFEKGYIQSCINAIEANNADVVGGAIETVSLNENKLNNSIIAVLSNALGVGNSMFRLGTDEAVEVDTVPYGLYRSEIFKEVGYYNEKLVRNQDIEFSKRLTRNGKKILLIPDISCKYYARENYRDIAQNNFQNGLWNIKTIFITKTFKSLSLRHFVPFFFLISLIIPVLYSFILGTIMFALFSLSVLLVYITLIAIMSKKLDNSKSSFLYIFFTFVIIHFSYGMGSFFGFFKR
jgi:glycosyltransferase involved in cell wall biosynthesis